MIKRLKAVVSHLQINLILKPIKTSQTYRFLLRVIDIYTKYAWVVPLKDKKGVSIVSAFQSILKKSNRKPNKIWVDKGRELFDRSVKSWLKKMI